MDFPWNRIYAKYSLNLADHITLAWITELLAIQSSDDACNTILHLDWHVI